MASPFRSVIRSPTVEALDLLATLESARLNLEEQIVWTTLLPAVSDQETLVLDKLRR